MGWKAGKCRHVQISELFSMGICDQAVMNFLVATEVGKFQRRSAELNIGFFFFRFSVLCGHSLYFSLVKGKNLKGRGRESPPPSQSSGGGVESGTAISYIE